MLRKRAKQKREQKVDAPIKINELSRDDVHRITLYDGRAMDNAENRYRKHIRGFSTVRFVAPVIDDRLLDYRSIFISHLPHC